MPNVVQSTYSERIDIARAGMIASSEYNTRTGVVETAAGVGWGLAVSQGVGDQGVILGGSAFVGVLVRDVAAGAGSSDKAAQYANAAFLTQGQIWVQPLTAVVAGAIVKYDTTTGVFDDTTGTTIPGARWVDSAAANGFARIELLANAGS